MHGMKYRVGQHGVTSSVHPSLQVRPFMTPHQQDLKGLLVALAAIAIAISTGLFCIPFLPLAQYNSRHQVLSALDWTLSVN